MKIEADATLRSHNLEPEPDEVPALHSRDEAHGASSREAVALYPDRADLFRNYPELKPGDVQQALAFAAANLDDSAECIHVGEIGMS
jgi:hypothetical protein